MVAARVREVREHRGMTTAELARRCAELGVPSLTTQALYKLEGQRDPAKRPPRPVSVDELLALALVLNVAPVHLIVPVDGDQEKYRITPEVQASRARVRTWIRGLQLPFRLPKVGDQRQFLSEMPEGEILAWRDERGLKWELGPDRGDEA
jgi:transcriptional regulator with XRE-family HTH domain